MHSAAKMRAEYSAWMLVVLHALMLAMPSNASEQSATFRLL
ncbi:hypothetical protein L810_4520 [Burkholderia sp. AU4i]|nr:hypothetical protein L810_4520 [Burkholderia sp. AU4i]